MVGRFITVDPIGLFGGNNNYEYVPNPTGWIDPLGLRCGEVAKTREEFNKKFPREQFPSAEHADEAWKVYQDTSKGNAEIVMGRLPDTKAGSEMGMQRLVSEKWSKEVNDAWVQGGIDANKKFYLGSDISIGNLRSQPYPHSRYPTTIFMRELKQLRAAGYKRVGDYMVPPT